MAPTGVSISYHFESAGVRLQQFPGGVVVVAPPAIGIQGGPWPQSWFVCAAQCDAALDALGIGAMATNIRAVITHHDVNGKCLTHFGIEAYNMTVATVDYNGIRTVLNNNGKLKGTTFNVHSYCNLDPQYNTGAGLIS